MKRKDRFTTKNDFFYALVVVAMFVVSTLNVGAVLLNAGTVSVSRCCGTRRRDGCRHVLCFRVVEVR